ncbi:hypothetical protein ADUPG1_008702 [Aduncisulcus paluster]|uniref:Chaoptin n=1 Tax=Aduncisulcus paluster TaxID=2918883 RepID=A0ABQ5KSY7_9EUKA|nr:hypothetical protein ADUPG1_008702 [Aduncisulcus paluster]
MNDAELDSIELYDVYSVEGLEYILGLQELSLVSGVFDFQPLSQLPNLTSLDFESNTINFIVNDSFFGLVHLQSFILRTTNSNMDGFLYLHSLFFSHKLPYFYLDTSSVFDVSPVYKNVKAKLYLIGANVCHSEEEEEFVSYFSGIFRDSSAYVTSISCSLETLDDSGQCDPTDPLCPSIVHNEVYNPYSWNGTGNIPGSKECSYISLREEDPLDSSSFVCHTIHDATLRKVINIALGNDNVDSFISVTDMRQLSGDLDVNAIITDNPDQFDETDIISSLRGIEYALSYVSNEYVGLTSITVSGHNIEDIEPLRYLVTLTSIDISDNQVSDVFPLFELSNLENLNLSNNPIDPTTFTVASLTSMFTQTDITIQVENIGGTTQCGTESATMPLDSHVVCRREEDDYLLDCAYGYYITSDSDDIVCSDQPNNICLGKYPMKSCVISDNSLYPFWRCVNGKYGPQCSYSVDIPDVRLRMKLCEIIYGQYGTCDLTEHNLNTYSGDDGFLDLSSSLISNLSGIENLSKISELDISSCGGNNESDYDNGNFLTNAIQPLINMPSLSSLNIDCRLNVGYELVVYVGNVWGNLEKFSMAYADFGDPYGYNIDVEARSALKMKSLNLSGFRLGYFDFLSDFPNLEELYISDLKSYPWSPILQSLRNLPNLKYLDINNSYFYKLEDFIDNLPSLEYWDLRDAKVSYISSLTTLDLFLIGKKKLKELYLDGLHHITSIPFIDLNLMTTLSVNSCNIYDISGLFFFDDIEYLDLDNNYFFYNNDIDKERIQNFLHPSSGKGVFPNIGDDSSYLTQNLSSDESKGEINIYNNHTWNSHGSHFCSQISKYVKSKDIDENSWDYCQTVHDRQLREYLCESVFRNSKDCFIRVDQLRNLSASDINSSSPGHLDLSNLSINSLRGLEFMTSLTFLDLSSNNIDDYTPILYLPNLININLSSNPICAKSSADLLRFVKLEYCSKHPSNTACLSESLVIVADSIRCPACSGDVIDADIVTNNSICHLGMVQCRLGYGLHVENQRCIKSTNNTCHICDAIGSICVASDWLDTYSFSCECMLGGDIDSGSIHEAQRCGYPGACSPSTYSCNFSAQTEIVEHEISSYLRVTKGYYSTSITMETCECMEGTRMDNNYKCLPKSNFWIWLGPCIFSTLIIIAFFIVFLVKKKTNSDISLIHEERSLNDVRD